MKNLPKKDRKGEKKGKGSRMCGIGLIVPRRCINTSKAWGEEGENPGPHTLLSLPFPKHSGKREEKQGRGTKGVLCMEGMGTRGSGGGIGCQKGCTRGENSQSKRGGERKSKLQYTAAGGEKKRNCVHAGGGLWTTRTKPKRRLTVSRGQKKGQKA